MTICRVGTTLVIADDIAADLLVVFAIVGIQTGNDHTPVRTLGRQARARFG